MSFRTVNGNTHTEDGWRCCNRDECDIVRIPGLTLVDTAPIRKGAPLIILGAWLYWYDRNVEEINSSVWGWSEDNDVLGQPGRNNGSNHLGGTAVDINAPKYPWGARVMPADRIAKIRAGQRLFEDSVFWGEDWSRADQMHHQMHWPEGDPRNDAFAQKLLGGYLGIYGQPAPPPVLSRADRYALLIIAEGQRRGISPKGIQIALATGLVESNITVYANSKVPASMQLPHDAVGSDGYSVGIFQQQVRDTGNGWWWGDAATCMDPTSSAGLFYGRLANLPYNGNSKTPGAFAQQIQQSAFPDRYDQRFNDAVALYNRLSGAQPIEEGFLMALSDQQQRELYDAVCGQRPSKSPLRPLAQGGNSIGNLRDVAGYVDGSEHWQAVKAAAELGHPTYLALLQEIAGADPARYPDRQDDAKLAQAILADIDAKKAQPQMISTKVESGGGSGSSGPYVAQTLPAPQVVYVDRPVPAGPPVADVPALVNGDDTGQVIGALYTALDRLRLADAMPIEARAPMQALISVLSTKNGTQL